MTGPAGVPVLRLHHLGILVDDLDAALGERPYPSAAGRLRAGVQAPPLAPLPLPTQSAAPSPQRSPQPRERVGQRLVGVASIAAREGEAADFEDCGAAKAACQEGP